MFGKVCSSVGAQYILQDMVNRCGIAGDFLIESAAATTEEIGNPIYPPAKRVLERHSIPVLHHRARQITRKDAEDYDYLIYMERYHESDIRRVIGAEKMGKACRLLDFTQNPRDIEDPWYTGEFEKAFSEIYEGCRAFLETVKKNETEGK